VQYILSIKKSIYFLTKYSIARLVKNSIAVQLSKNCRKIVEKLFRNCLKIVQKLFFHRLTTREISNFDCSIVEYFNNQQSQK